MRANKKITAKLINIKNNDRSFDIEFWQQAGAEARFAAAWQMVKEYLIMRGENESQFRL